MKQEREEGGRGSGTMGRSVDGAAVHVVVTSCSLFGALFVVLSALSVTILVAVNWRPWRIYRYLPELQNCFLLVCIVFQGCICRRLCLCVSVNWKSAQQMK